MRGRGDISHRGRSRFPVAPAPSRPGFSGLFPGESRRICLSGGYFGFCFSTAAGPCGSAGPVAVETMGTGGPGVDGVCSAEALFALQTTPCRQRSAGLRSATFGVSIEPLELACSPFCYGGCPGYERFRGDFARTSPLGLWMQPAIIFRLPLTSQSSGL